MTVGFRVLVLCVLLGTFSQRVDASKFYSVNSLYGISLREVNSVCSDDYGFVWASSITGILRLTEDDYRIYQLPYENANVISVKLLYQQGKLLAYTNNGQLFYFNQLYNKFEFIVNFSKVLDDKHLVVREILVDDAGGYLIATTSGLYKYEMGNLKLVYGIFLDYYTIAWYDKQNVIIARDNGLLMLNTKTLQTQTLIDFKTIGTLDASSLHIDEKENTLWIGTMSKGLLMYNFNTKEISRLLPSIIPHQPILAIERSTDESFIIGIDGQGVWELNNKGTKVLNVFKEQIDDPSSLRGNGVYDLYCDENQRIWVCTYSGGLSFFDQTTPLVNQIVHKTNSINSLVNNDVNRVFEDKHGKIWFATNNGISFWDRGKNKWQHLYNNLNQEKVFLAICNDNRGRIWAGTYSYGLYILDEVTGREIEHLTKNTTQNGAVSDYIFDLFKDSEGDIWIGGINDDISCFLVKENRYRTYYKDAIRKFAELEPNKILLGCSYGLSVLEKETGVSKQLLIGYSVRDVFVQGNDIWLCTGGDGLIKYNFSKEKIEEQFTIESGLPSNFVNSVVSDGTYLWIGTENGMCRFNAREKTFVTYSSIYQLSRTSFNNSSYAKLNNGQFIWGTNNGALIFDPKSISDIPSTGRIYLQDIAISGLSIRNLSSYQLTSPIDSLSSITLNYYQNTINIELLPLKTTAGSKFSWKLEGFDTDWSLPTDSRILTYMNIPTGKYILKLRLHDGSLSKIISERLLHIEVVPPFWKRFWFWGIIYVILLGLALLVLQLYVKSIKQKHSEEKVKFFTNTAHDIRTSLTLIKAPIEELNRELTISDLGKQYLSLAIEQVRRLSFVVTQLMDFQKVDIGKEQLILVRVNIVGYLTNRISMFKSLAQTKNVEIIFKSNVESYHSGIDEVIFDKVVDNLISNAIKYSHPQSKVYIDFVGADKNWVLQIKDTGIGMSKLVQSQLFKEFYRGENAINSKVVGSGIGLVLVKNYVDLHGGSVKCYSIENEGSTFTVSMPYIEIGNTEKSEETFNTQLTIQNSDGNIIPILPVFDNATHDVNVLIVEDNDDLLSFMRSALSREFQITTAENGEKAWEIIKENLPDIIVTDIMMEEMDGFELCRLIKSDYETAHIPVVLLTALSEKTQQLRGLGLGADDYLTKPFDMNLLVQRIKSIIQNRIIVRDKALQQLKNESNSEPIILNDLNDKFMKKMMDVAKENMSNAEFNKESFATAMNVSPSLLYKKVKSLTNLSPTDFIKIVRLDYSKILLQSGQYNVTEVSELCGFTSVAYFSTVFRKHFGKSPTDCME